MNGIIPELLWKILEVRVLILVSLWLQVILIVFGNRRKYIANKWLQLGVWVTYLSADWVATYALGILSTDSKTATRPEFIIWASFLLLHLGGPDTITAYSYEDNEQWLWHMFGLISHLIVVAPIVQISWVGGNLFHVTIPVMVAGVIKYVERTWSFWLGSSEEFKESILSLPHPGPNYEYFSLDLNENPAEGNKIWLMVESTPPVSFYHCHLVITNDMIQDIFFLHHAFYLFTIFQFLFSNLIVSIQEHQNSQCFFQNLAWDDAFKVIEVELGLVYDKLYTKALTTCTCLGIFFRCVSFLCTLYAFISFYYLVIDRGHTAITLVLFIGSILFEIYAMIVLLSSSWGRIWFSNQRQGVVDLLYKFISGLQPLFCLSHTIQWWNLVSQFNLIHFCLKDDKPFKCLKFKKLRRFKQFLKKTLYVNTEPVPEKLKELIFERLREKSFRAKHIKACKILCSNREDGVLNKWKCHSIYWSIKVEFDESILIWHIATDLCYYADVTAESSATVRKNCETSTFQHKYLQI